MVRQADQPDHAGSDLDQTAELLALDVGAYELGLDSGERPAELPAAEPSDTADDASKRPALPALPATETLRDIEAWIAAQDARARNYERALADLQQARHGAEARAENLALELEIAQKALHTALCRANDGERAALDNGAAARSAESRAAQLQRELEEVRRELATAAGHLSAATAELAGARDSLAGKALEHEEVLRRQAELTQTLEARCGRIAELEGEVAGLRTHTADADRELAQRAERLAASHAANELHQAAVSDLARERDALAIRIATVMESAQANEWKRNVWHSTWRALESDLTEAREELRRVAAERAGLAAEVTKAHAELSERDAAIAHLKAEGTAQVTALAELAATRSHEQGDYTRSTQELRAHAETLAAQIKALEERQRCSAESLAAREAELAESHAARLRLEETLRTVQSGESAQAARGAELEGLAGSLSRALQAQTEIAQRASELIAARDGELAEGRARVGALEAELQAATRQLGEQTAVVQSKEAALNASVAQLGASQDRVANLEREATGQSQRLAAALTQLAHARTLAEQAEASRRPLESELARRHAELERETRRANALDAVQRNLALELERTRGALDERDLQLRRLERYATASAQVLSRIKVGIERRESNPQVETLELPEYGGTLVSLDDSEAPALPLGRYTTIGRASESDVCLKDSSISRRHAVVTIGPSGAFIEDLRSVNGVLVNQQRIRHARLADGDVIELGAKRFRFTVPAAGPADAGVDGAERQPAAALHLTVERNIAGVSAEDGSRP